MLTSRGWWLLLITLFVTALGALWAQLRGVTLVIIGLTLLAFIVVEWCRFLLTLQWGLPLVRVEREVRDERGPVTTLWAKRPFTVIVRVTTSSRMPMPLALM